MAWFRSGHKGDAESLVFADFPSDQRFPRSDRFSGGVLKSYV